MGPLAPRPDLGRGHAAEKHPKGEWLRCRPSTPAKDKPDRSADSEQQPSSGSNNEPLLIPTATQDSSI
jgi:hypothetical protein